MSTDPNRLTPPVTPAGILPEKPEVLGGPDTLRKEYVTQEGYAWGHVTVLSHLLDEVELEVGPETYERMSKDPKIHKIKRIRINGVLTDDLIFAPGRTEEEVGPQEYKRYEEFMKFAERIIGGLDTPYWRVLEQMMAGQLEQGHKIGEVVREYRLDETTTRPATTNTKKRGAKPRQTLIGRLNPFRAAEPEAPEDEGQPKRRGTSIMRQPKIRLLPKTIKVKPRGSVLFVVDQYFNVLGLIPAWAEGRVTAFNVAQVITRDKFIVLVNNPEDSDPRGNSAWRPMFTWWNFKQHVPKEYLRYLLQEAMPVPVMTLPPNMEKWMMKRSLDGEIEYEADGRTPKLIEATEAAALTIQNMRNGKGVAIPDGASLEAYTGKGASGDEVFPNAINVADRQMEDSGLNQTLAQSEGEHQARAASETAEGRLMDVFFWDKRAISVMTLYDLIAVDFRNNFGDWAMKYMPKLSLGDSEKRDWAKDLETIAKAYFQGFIDDTQRAELMAWLSLPRPGPSRAEVMAEIDPTNGEARMSNKNRPDQKPENQGRNDGNSTEKAQSGDVAQLKADLNDLYRRVHNAQVSQSGVFAVGHHTRRRGTFVEYLHGGPRS